MTRIVTTTYRYKRPPRKRKPVKIEAATVTVASKRRRVLTLVNTPDEAKPVPPANDDRKPAIVTTTSRKHAKLARALKAADAPDDDPEATARVKAFFARMIRPGGALPPEKR